MVIEKIIKEFPNLLFVEQENSLSGVIEIYPGDSYDIKIYINNLPHLLPRIYEEGERIPHKSSRHLYPDGALCLATPLTMNYLLKTSVKSLYDYISKLVVPFLKNNSYFELTGHYSFGEHSHNIVEATFESLIDLLKTENRLKIIELLQNMYVGKKITPNEKCYCGSDIKIKKCEDHFIRYKSFKAIGRNNLIKTIAYLIP